MYLDNTVGVALFGRGVYLGQVDWGGEKKWSYHLVFWPRNHVYSTLTWKD